jgi:hypothetical protein
MGQLKRLALRCNARLCATNCVVRICGAPSEGTPSAARTLIVMATWAAARARARSRRRGRLLGLGAGVP